MTAFSGVYRIKNDQNGTFLTMMLTGTKTSIVCSTKAGGRASLWWFIGHGGPTKRYILRNVEYEFEAQCDTREGFLYGVTNGHPWIFETLSLGGIEYYYIRVGYNNLVMDPGPVTFVKY